MTHRVVAVAVGGRGALVVTTKFPRVSVYVLSALPLSASSLTSTCAAGIVPAASLKTEPAAKKVGPGPLPPWQSKQACLLGLPPLG